MKATLGPSVATPLSEPAGVSWGANEGNARPGLPGRASLTSADGLRPSLAYGLLRTAFIRTPAHTDLCGAWGKRARAAQ